MNSFHSSKRNIRTGTCYRLLGNKREEILAFIEIENYVVWDTKKRKRKKNTLVLGKIKYCYILLKRKNCFLYTTKTKVLYYCNILYQPSRVLFKSHASIKHDLIGNLYFYDTCGTNFYHDTFICIIYVKREKKIFFLLLKIIFVVVVIQNL